VPRRGCPERGPLRRAHRSWRSVIESLLYDTQCPLPSPRYSAYGAPRGPQLAPLYSTGPAPQPRRNHTDRHGHTRTPPFPPRPRPCPCRAVCVRLPSASSAMSTVSTPSIFHRIAPAFFSSLPPADCLLPRIASMPFLMNLGLRSLMRVVKASGRRRAAEWIPDACRVARARIVVVGRDAPPTSPCRPGRGSRRARSALPHPPLRALRAGRVSVRAEAAARAGERFGSGFGGGLTGPPFRCPDAPGPKGKPGEHVPGPSAARCAREKGTRLSL